jgi:hypothetical protein
MLVVAGDNPGSLQFDGSRLAIREVCPDDSVCPAFEGVALFIGD